MIQAAINPETGEFLGLIVPKADLTGDLITVFGTEESWARIAKGEEVDPREAGVVFALRAIEMVPVDNLCPPGGQEGRCERCGAHPKNIPCTLPPEEGEDDESQRN